MSDGAELTIWVGACRYYLGRTSNFSDALCDVWSELSGEARHIIRRDVEEAFAQDDKDRQRGGGQGYHALGRDCDRAAWEDVRRLWAPT